MKVTIKDVAREAGCGITAVSNIINRNKLDEYPEKTVERIKKIAREMGYISNKTASSLRTGKTGAIGITHSFLMELETGFISPYQNDIHIGIGRGLRGTGYNLLFQNVTNLTGDQNHNLLIQSRQIDGLIYVYYSGCEEVFEEHHLPVLQKADIPVVIIHSEPRSFPFSSVGFDCEAGGRLATTHLVEHGYRSVGFVGTGYNRKINDMFFTGLKAALQEGGIDLQPEHCYDLEQGLLADGVTLAEKLAEKKDTLPRALFVTEEPVAHGLIKGFADHGISVPGDVALIGFGDYHKGEQIVHGLTCLKQPAITKGETACRELIKMLDGKDTLREPQTTVLQPALHIRKSCGCS